MLYLLFDNRVRMQKSLSDFAWCPYAAALRGFRLISCLMEVRTV